MATTMTPSEEGHIHGEERPHGHSRNRSGKSSADSSKARAPKPPSQKAMLSRALQKANSAVLLDNNQDFRGARQAYAEACELLHQVLQRTSGDEDKRKLEAIRRTYSSRISELDQMLSLWHNGKSLPAYPDEEVSNRRTIIQHAPEREADPTTVETVTLRRIGREDNQTPHAMTHANTHTQHHQYQHQQQTRQEHRPPRLQSPDTDPIHSPEHGFLHSSFNRTPVRSRFPDHVMSSAMNASSSYKASTTVQPSSGLHGDGLDGPIRTDFSVASETRRVIDHTRENSQSSWLDPIDESGGSNASSVHSRTSSLGYRRRHIRSGSGNTEAEFDTALDAAIEAAYDEGYEPMDDNDINSNVPDEEVVANALRKVEIARERVRQTEREAYEVASEHERQRLMLLQHPPMGQTERYHAHQGQDYFFDDNSSDEEERMLDEITRDLASQDFNAHGQAQSSSLTRESEPSSLAANAWHSSAGSSALGSSTSLSTVTESMPAPYIPSGPALAPPPTHALPDLPSDKVSSALAGNTNRRQSTQNYKQLKIETKRLAMPETSSNNETPQANVVSTDKGDIQTVELARPTTASRQPPSAEISPTDPRSFGSPLDNRPDGEESSTGRSGSPTSGKLKKNFSSSSLRSLKARNLSVSNLDESEISPGAAMGAHWGINSRAPTMPVMPTPLAATLRDRAETAVGGLFLLEHHFHSPDSPGSPNPTVSEAPVPLEPCPTDFMLRPFWLMRCLYQTLVHPRGGYLSLKLFVPREAWRVKGVKLKNIEDKIANCDFLTAALLKLAKVDTFDADALLEEMQALENILEQIQAALTRKLGNEVGIHSTGSLFKDGLGGTDGDSGAVLPRSSSVSGKSSFSWRRLRPKNSSSALATSHLPIRNAGNEGNKDSIPTLPMTAQPTSRPARRDTGTAQFSGPYAQYMGSLARLFDAVQVIDQIARQVEDPGLRHADKTQVGLELSARHAAEFFAFYICRFVLSDLGLLMDKFIKRGTEWVLA
ncbi:unnamed protein product [Clonostachys chloroleuca]|uniref:MIT domain-containing protein n=1 Tax=Clonostachys chloroleuca TaxID=1926264 RepID=A0AA35QCT4_9HYPO|nr:unnamed protein product [Clonostachys chloroleuca]